MADDDDLMKSLEEATEGCTSNQEYNEAELDSFVEDDKASNKESKTIEKILNENEKTDKPNVDSSVTISNGKNGAEKFDETYFKPPLNQSTPLRVTSSRSIDSNSSSIQLEDFQNASSIASTTKTEDILDYSILELEENEAYQTLTLDEYAEGFEDDYSILDSDDEDEEESTITEGNEVTQIECPKLEKKADENVKEGASTTEGESSKAKNEQVEVKKVEPEPEKPKDQKVEKFKKNIRRQYYDHALPKWKATLESPYAIPNPNDYRLRDPLVWKFNNKTVKETMDEWADKHHPMWEPYREKCQSDAQIAAYIHHKWDWNTTIDMTRNLTKFSHKSRDTSIAESENGKESNSNENGNGSANRNETEKKLAGCKFCISFCHCSPGRRLKRPYSNVNEGDPQLEDKHVVEKKLRFQQVEHEIRDTLNTQVQEKSLSKRDRNFEIDYFTNAASNVLGSNNEIFEMLQFYRKSAKECDIPTFTREQVRELLCVENTQSKYRNYYLSAYAGEGLSDYEESSSDEDDDDDDDQNSESKNDKKEKKEKIEKKTNNEKDMWKDKSILENY